MIEQLSSCLSARSTLDHAILASVLAMTAMALAVLAGQPDSAPALAAAESAESQPA